MQQAISRRRFTFIAIAYFAALALFLFGDALFDSGAIISGPVSDMDMYFYPVRLFAFGQMRAGHLPLWNPYVLGGIPVLGNFQYAVLYPPNWLHLILPPILAINLNVILHAVLAGIFTAVWCRMRGAGLIGSLLGGTLFILSGAYTMRVYAGHLATQCVMAWMPAVFCCIDWLIDDRRRLPAILTGAACVAMQILAGYPQLAYLTGLAVGLYVVIRTFGITMRRILGLFALLYALGAGLAAAQLIPGIAAGSESVRGAIMLPWFAMSNSLPPENLMTSIAPDLFGDGINAPMFARRGMSENSLFVGVVSAILVIVGLTRVRGRRDSALVITMIFMLVLAMGKYALLYEALFKVLPGFNRFRVPARAATIAALMASAMAAMGWDWLLNSPRRSIVTVATALGAAAMSAAALFISKSSLWHEIIAWMVRSGDTLGGDRWLSMPEKMAASAHLAGAQLLFAAKLCGMVTLLLIVASRRVGVLYLLPALMLCELWIGSPLLRVRAYARTQPPRQWQATLDHLHPDQRVLMMGKSISNLPIQFGVEGIGGYDPSVSLRWHNVVVPCIAAEPLGGNLEAFVLPPANIADLLRLGATLPPTQNLAANPMPRASLIGECIVMPSPGAALKEISKESFGPWRTVVLEEWPSPAPKPVAPGQSAGIVRVSSISSDRMEIHADVNSDAVLLITDAYASGWRVRLIESGPQSVYQVLPADCCMRGIPLSAGKHHFILEYRPVSVIIGFIVSLISIAGWIIAWFTLLRWRRV